MHTVIYIIIAVLVALILVGTHSIAYISGAIDAIEEILEEFYE